MYKNTRTARTLTTLGGGAVVSLALCFPASAADGDRPADGVDIGAAKHGGIPAPSMVDVGAAKHGGIDAPPRIDVGRLLNDIDTPTGSGQLAPSASPEPAAPTGQPVEWDQIALGALGGLALAGISLVALRHRSTHRVPRPT